ncbi:MAG: hydroxyacid dehydrogenase [Clostridia bacterium]|nr:hydroxyacid dehydrogenase [Clostridia bacterium]
MKAAFFCQNPDTIEKDVYGGGRCAKVAELVDLYPVIITPENIDEHLPALHDIEAIFSTWGVFVPTEEQFAAMPNLKIMFYAAGSVRNFAPPYFKHGVRVVSAVQANGTAVAEFTLAQILLANKGYFQNIRVSDSLATKYDWPRPLYGGNYDRTVAILGAGTIGKKVIEFLKNFSLKVIVYDPFLPDETAAELNVEKVSLEEAFARGNVVSCHIANLPETQHILRKEHFDSMLPGATFINTGRGAQVDEDGMIAALTERPDLFALLDVTMPEPPLEDSPLYTLKNVYLSNHIAGTMEAEHRRMADDCIEECKRYLAGDPLKYEITLPMLEHMA